MATIWDWLAAMEADRDMGGAAVVEVDFWGWTERFSWAAAVLGALIALVGILFVLVQLRTADRQQRWAQQHALDLSKAQVLLAADNVLAWHSEAAANLRPGGCWHRSSVRPSFPAELSLVEPYIGAFESIFVAVTFGQIEPALLQRRYGYRVANIWANKALVNAKLQSPDLREGWADFIALTWVLEEARGYRFENHTDDFVPEVLGCTSHRDGRRGDCADCSCRLRRLKALRSELSG